MSLDRISAVLDIVGRSLAAVCCATLFLLLISDIVLRKLGVSFLWPIEYNGFLMAFIVFLPLAGITRRREHLAADFFLSAIGGPFERASRRWVIPLAQLLFCAALTFLAWHAFSTSWVDEINSLGPLRTPMWIPQSVMVVALAAAAVSALADLVRGATHAPGAERETAEGGR